LSDVSFDEFNKKKPMTNEIFELSMWNAFGLPFFWRAESPIEAVCINIQSDKNHLVTRKTLFIFVIIDNRLIEWRSHFLFLFNY